MKGLFVKDLKLMMLQKNFLLLILAIVIGMMIFTDDVIFPLSFLSFIVSLFTVSTISYDDFDNGNAFLFTLPITRNHYVSEKYFLIQFFSNNLSHFRGFNIFLILRKKQTGPFFFNTQPYKLT